SNYLFAYNKNKIIAFGKSGSKLFQEEIEGNIEKKSTVMNKNGTCIVATDQDPYILNVFSISGKKSLSLKLKEPLGGVDISDDDKYIIYYYELFVGDSLKYIMKLVDIKTGKEIWERALSLYTEEFPEIYIGKEHILLNYYRAQNKPNPYTLYLYDFKGNLIGYTNSPQKPLLSTDRKYILIFDVQKVFMYEINPYTTIK
ncbi:hypothetical protein HY745_14790, partial [Candidatus Desantisbacteria bacterium]|nr:hypothetical protein [Candidatus Desantisbacteria bacterium]